MRSPWLWSASSLLILLAAAAPAPAATILERSEEIEVRPDGSVTERVRLRVRLDTDTDLASWSPFPVYLDQHRTLESLSAAATRPDGKVLNVARRALDTVEHAGDYELHSSRKFRTVTFPEVPAGSVLALDYVVRERPYFPSGLVGLAWSEPTESLRVEVKGAGAGWRWRLDGKLAGLEVKETPGGVVVTGRNLPRISPPDYAPGSATDGAVLRYGWGDPQGWEGVGRWYDRLVSEVPRNAAAVRDKARELTAGRASRREKAEILAAFARRQVRYVAVEVGIGGYRPSSPQDVLQRRWGDCKDKAFLLIDLLREVGIEAWPVLIQAAETDRVDREFPSPNEFNHAIVAVSPEGLELGEDAPVAGGYLFVDATQTYGGLEWLQPAAQDQDALVIRDGRGILVRTPVRHGQELSRLAADFGADLKGEARLELTGGSAAAFLDLLATGRPEEVDRVVRQVFGSYFPAADLAEPRWTTRDTGLPTANLAMKVRLPAPAAGSEPGWPALTVPGETGGLPAASLLDGRVLPIVTAPHVREISWGVALPGDDCKPADGQDVKVENALGAFHQKVIYEPADLGNPGGPGRVRLERRTELKRRWIEPADFAPLKEISLAEHRSGKRRLRGVCRAGGG
jgi:transglutaminase-like putative cysteine protease